LKPWFQIKTIRLSWWNAHFPISMHLWVFTWGRSVTFASCARAHMSLQLLLTTSKSTRNAGVEMFSSSLENLAIFEERGGWIKKCFIQSPKNQSRPCARTQLPCICFKQSVYQSRGIFWKTTQITSILSKSFPRARLALSRVSKLDKYTLLVWLNHRKTSPVKPPILDKITLSTQSRWRWRSRARLRRIQRSALAPVYSDRIWRKGACPSKGRDQKKKNKVQTWKSSADTSSIRIFVYAFSASVRSALPL
jgi:hypothetical protein